MGSAKKARDKRPASFVAIPRTVIRSKAYIDLPNAAKGALPYFFDKVHKWFDEPERYQEEFLFPYAAGKVFGYAAGTFSKIIQDLVRFGFLDPVDKGGLRGMGKSCSVFRLSTRWAAYEMPDFKKIDWKCFVPKPRLRVTAKNEMDKFKK